MTSYYGGKKKLGREIAVVIHAFTDSLNPSSYCEPFCGMCGVLRHINVGTTKYAGDINESVIMMWKAAQNGWLPDITDLSKERYAHLRAAPNSAERGFFGHALSFHGKFFHGYWTSQRSCTEQHSRCLHARKCVQDIATELGRKNVMFSHGSYGQFSDLTNSVIYCDPPYIGTQNSTGWKFDSNTFENWCYMMAAKGNYIFISGYTPPGEIIWTKPTQLRTSKGNIQRTEKLGYIAPRTP
ncbi:hypothetical protein EMVG_00061 [Emiliania huxleyi virus PS401]|nr:hypothetical protein EMVG_00061 [Emiliania huxleyi virus PS401]